MANIELSYGSVFPLAPHGERGYKTPLAISSNGLVAYTTEKFCYVAHIDDLVNAKFMIQSPNSCCSLNFSDDASLLAVGHASSAEILKLDYDNNNNNNSTIGGNLNYQIIKTYNGLGSNKVSGICFSKDSKHLLTAGDLSEDAAVCTQLSNDQILKTFPSKIGNYNGCAVSKTGDTKNHLVCYSPQYLTCFTFAPLKLKESVPVSNIINHVCFLPQSHKFLASASMSPITLHDCTLESTESSSSMRSIQSYAVPGVSIQKTVFGFALDSAAAASDSNSSKFMAAYGTEGILRFWDVEKATIIGSIERVKSARNANNKVASMLTNCAFYGNIGLAVALDGTLMRFDIRSMEETCGMEELRPQVQKFLKQAVKKPFHLPKTNNYTIGDNCGNIYEFTMNDACTKFESQRVVLNQDFDAEKNFLLESQGLASNHLILNFTDSSQILEDCLSNEETHRNNVDDNSMDHRRNLRTILSDQHPSMMLPVGNEKLFLFVITQSQEVKICDLRHQKSAAAAAAEPIIKTLIKTKSKVKDMIFDQSATLLCVVEEKKLSIFAFDANALKLDLLKEEESRDGVAFVTAAFEPLASSSSSSSSPTPNHIMALYTKGVKLFEINDANNRTSRSLKAKGLRYSPVRSSSFSAIAWNAYDPKLIALGTSNSQLIVLDAQKMNSQNQQVMEGVCHKEIVQNLEWLATDKLLVHSMNQARIVKLNSK